MMTQLTIKCVIREISTFYSVRARMCMCGSGSGILLAFVHARARARSWREFAKSRFTHFPSILSVHVDSYASHLTRRLSGGSNEWQRSYLLTFLCLWEIMGDSCEFASLR